MVHPTDEVAQLGEHRRWLVQAFVAGSIPALIIMSKMVKKLRKVAYKISTPPDISALLDKAADMIETLLKEKKKK